MLPPAKGTHFTVSLTVSTLLLSRIPPHTQPLLSLPFSFLRLGVPVYAPKASNYDWAAIDLPQVCLDSHRNELTWDDPQNLIRVRARMGHSEFEGVCRYNEGLRKVRQPTIRGSGLSSAS
jgi:hypothetical protein